MWLWKPNYQTTGALFLAFLLLTHAVAAIPAFAAWEPRLSLESRFGTSRSSGSLQVMVPIAQDEESMLFVDLRGVASNDRSVERNLGAGYRWMAGDGSAIYGAYLFGDRRRTASGNLWDQVTAGFEVIGIDTDYRLNVYVPRTGRQLVSSVVDDAVIVSGSTLIYEDALLNTYEVALGGWDVGMSRRLSWEAGDARLGLRAYHFGAEDVPAVAGGSVRLETRYRDVLNLPGSQLTLGLEAQSDNVRGSQVFVTAGLSVPFGAGTIKGHTRETALRDRMMEPVVRDIDIIVASTAPVREIQHESEALDSETGQRVSGVLFVSADGKVDARGGFDDPLDVAGLNERLAEEAESGNHHVVVIPIGEEEIHTGEDSLVLQPGNTLKATGELAVRSGITGRSVVLWSGKGATPLTNEDNPVVVVSGDNRIIGVTTVGGTNSVYSGGASGQIVLEGVDMTGTSGDVVDLETAGDLELSIVDSTLEGEGGVRVYAQDGTGNVGVDIQRSALRANGASALSFTGAALGDAALNLSGSAFAGGGLTFDVASGGVFTASFSGSDLEIGGLTVKTNGASEAWVAIEDAVFELPTGNFTVDVRSSGLAQIRVEDSAVSGTGAVGFGAASSQGAAGIELRKFDLDTTGNLLVLADGESDASISVVGGEAGGAMTAAGAGIRANGGGQATVKVVNETIRATSTNGMALVASSDMGNAYVEVASSDLEAASGYFLLQASATGAVGEGFGNAEIAVSDSKLKAGTIQNTVKASGDAAYSLVTTGAGNQTASIEAASAVDLTVDAGGNGEIVIGGATANVKQLFGFLSAGENFDFRLSDSNFTMTSGVFNVVISAESAAAAVKDSSITSSKLVFLDLAVEGEAAISISGSAISSATDYARFNAKGGGPATIAVHGSQLAASTDVTFLAKASEGDAEMSFVDSTITAGNDVMVELHAENSATAELHNASVTAAGDIVFELIANEEADLEATGDTQVAAGGDATVNGVPYDDYIDSK